MAVADVTKVLDDAGADYELLHHAHTERAVAEAEALGLSPAEVAKTLIARTPDGRLRVLVSASDRIDMRKLREAVGASKDDVQLSTEEEMARDYPEFALGAVPPVGGSRHDPVIVDRKLAEREWLVFEAGTHDDSVRIRTKDFMRITDARTAELCEA
jgi:prolyl-tRNA editing enzyme YbaK/EbsC (Cys-tRNA(Pro) deacylase)